MDEDIGDYYSDGGPDYSLYEQEEEGGMCGFTEEETDELLSYGEKPWEEDAPEFLEELHEAQQEVDAQQDEKP